MNVPLLRVSALCFRHDHTRPLLEGVTFELHAGERLGLAGHNGCGKSSLLQLLVGLYRPVSGDIEIFGRARQCEGDFHEVRGRVGLMFQEADDQLFCPTVEEDVAFGPLNQGRTPHEVRDLVIATLERLGLRHLSARPIHHLSGGEKRLVALAGVLAMQPEVLLLDEPLSGLDEVAQARVLEILHALPQAMIVVSHDRLFLNRVVSRLVTLRNGVLCDEPVPHAH